jgi:hypothetical protein
LAPTFFGAKFHHLGDKLEKQCESHKRFFLEKKMGQSYHNILRGKKKKEISIFRQ